MNWDAIGAIGEVVGAVAVVLTLGYLAVSIRQTITTVKIDSRQRVLDRYSDALSNVLAPNVLDAMRNGLQNYDGLSSKDQAAFTLAQTIFANNLLNAMRLRDEGMILPARDGHPARRVNYDKAEVNDEQTNEEIQTHTASTYARISNSSTGIG